MKLGSMIDDWFLQGTRRRSRRCHTLLGSGVKVLRGRFSSDTRASCKWFTPLLGFGIRCIKADDVLFFAVGLLVRGSKT